MKVKKSHYVSSFVLVFIRSAHFVVFFEDFYLTAVFKFLLWATLVNAQHGIAALYGYPNSIRNTPRPLPMTNVQVTIVTIICGSAAVGGPESLINRTPAGGAHTRLL